MGLDEAFDQRLRPPRRARGAELARLLISASQVGTPTEAQRDGVPERMAVRIDGYWMQTNAAPPERVRSRRRDAETFRMKAVVCVSAVTLLVFSPEPRAQQAVLSPEHPTPSLTSAPMLAPTNHPRLPLDASHLWFAPQSTRPQAAAALMSAMKLLDKGNEAQALAVFSQAAVQQGVLGSYAIYYAGRAQQRIGKPADAIRTFRVLQERDPIGYLREASALGEAESLEVVGEHAAAMIVYERLSRERPVALDEVLMRLGREAEAVGDEARAIEAYARVYYEFPLSEVAPLAKARLDGFPNFQRRESEHATLQARARTR